MNIERKLDFIIMLFIWGEMYKNKNKMIYL